MIPFSDELNERQSDRRSIEYLIRSEINIAVYLVYKVLEQHQILPMIMVHH